MSHPDSISSVSDQFLICPLLRLLLFNTTFNQWTDPFHNFIVWICGIEGRHCFITFKWNTVPSTCITVGTTNADDFCLFWGQTQSRHSAWWNDSVTLDVCVFVCIAAVVAGCCPGWRGLRSSSSRRRSPCCQSREEWTQTWSVYLCYYLLCVFLCAINPSICVFTCWLVLHRMNHSENSWRVKTEMFVLISPDGL